MEVENRYVTIKHHIDGSPSESDLQVCRESLVLETEAGGDVIVRTIYVSADPYLLNRMKRQSSSHRFSVFSARLDPGMKVPTFGIGKVVASAREEFKCGDLVAGLLSWEDYSVVKPGIPLNKITVDDRLPPTYYASALGTSGLAAYAGFYDICKPKKGEKVFVSAAAGSVGSLVGQFAKLAGCYVVGCAGSKKKVDLLKEKLGFHDAFNYKDEPDLRSALQRCFPEGIDIYFDNVGGEMLEAAVSNMNMFGRVAVCGVISEYTDAGNRAAPDMMEVIYKRLSIRGFLASDHVHLYSDFMSETCEHLKNGRVQVLEDISKGLEQIPSAFVGLFRGDNIGKKLVKVSEI